MASISSTGDGLDNLVDIITQKVQARLSGSPTDPGHDPNTPCNVDLEDCNACGFCVTRKQEAGKFDWHRSGPHWRGTRRRKPR